MDKSILNQFRLTVTERNLGVYGVIVHREGQEDIEHRWRADDNVCLYSGSKTFTSVGVGICRDEGGLKLEDKVLDYFPEYRSVASPGSEEITLRDLLHMASGKHAFWFTADDAAKRTSDWALLFFKEPMSSKPGSHFFYSNACTYMLGRVIEKISGVNSRDYLAPRLFEPLGIYNPQWHTCPGGHTLAATALYLKTSEFARLGRLLLNEGMCEGRRIVSKEYVSLMHEDIIDNHSFSPDQESAQGYGYQLWRCVTPGVYRADGMYGQFSIVVPGKKAVITLTSHNESNPNDIVRAVESDIIPLL